MKIASFQLDGEPRYGLVTEAGVVPTGAETRRRLPSLRDALAAGAFSEMAAAATADPIPLHEIDFLPVIPSPDKVICVGRNYAAHAAESGGKPTEFPNLFLRLTNTLVGHGHALLRPRLSDKFDYEGELAVVIGKGGRHIPEADALDHVAGYTCFNDGSIRDVQFKHSLIAGKNFIRTGGFGPWLTTADEIADPAALTVTSRLNGRELQRGYTRDLIFSVPYLIAYVSGFTELSPGDVIATGTPEGVGFARDPQLWMQPGDTVEVEIEGVGLLRNTVVAES